VVAVAVVASNDIIIRVYSYRFVIEEIVF
jgi:hypothetical protein